MRPSLEACLYAALRILCALGLIWYIILNKPDFLSGLFVLVVLSLFCVGADNFFKTIFFSRAVHSYLDQVDYVWEIANEGVAIDKYNHRVVAGDKDWVISFNAAAIAGLELFEEDGQCRLALTVGHEDRFQIVVNFGAERGMRTEAYERLRVMMRLSETPNDNIPTLHDRVPDEADTENELVYN